MTKKKKNKKLKTDLTANYLINGYLNYPLNFKTDQKIRNLNLG